MKYRDYVKQEIAVIKDRDPAIKSDKEVYLYPSFKAILKYRKAHKLYLKGEYYKARKIHRKLQDRLELRYIRERRLAKDFLLTMDMELLSERQLLSVTM
jgi:serine acetyltransferase